MLFPYGDTITLHSRTGATRDGGNNDVPVYADSTLVGGFAPAGSVEVVQGQDTVTTTPSVYLPAGTVVKAVDQMTVRGVLYDVQGDPQDWGHPFTGWQAGIVVRLQGVTG